MLSYRHSFHAGNFADIIKHVVLVEILQHLIQKETSFEYIDTHAGAGLFNLDSIHAKKLQEHAKGITKLKPEAFPELSAYFDVVNAYNKPGTLSVYPGSPSIAKHFLRPQDRSWLYELHPQDYQSLHDNMKKNKKTRIACKDGLKSLEALLPPASRRAVVLIDPSYEIKHEYDLVFDAVLKAHKKFATGIYAIWYPVVDRGKIKLLEKKFKNSGIKNIQRFELGITADSDEHGMTSSGMLVINPPWRLFEKMSQVLPRLAQVLGKEGGTFFKCDILSAE